MISPTYERPVTDMKQKLRPMEILMNGVFFLCGFIAIVFVLFISVYLVLSGLPAIREIGLREFLFGTRWASTAAEPAFGILTLSSPQFTALPGPWCWGCRWAS